MPKQLPQLHNASRAHIAKKSSSSHVWISDQLLSDTFASFARTHRRHGSNVPGPLEAQRRAKGRRATTVTHAPAVPAADIRALNAARPQRGWWNSGKNGAALPGLFDWSLGLFDSSLRSQPREASRSDKAKNEELDSLKETLSPGQMLLFESQLETLTTHQQLIKLLDELKIDLIHNHDAAQKPLDVILRNKWSPEELAHFLLDPRTNPPGTRNHVRTLQAVCAGRPYLGRYLINFTVLNKAIQLGLVQTADLKDLLLSVCDLELKAICDHDPASLCNELLKALRQSRVLSESDLDLTTRLEVSKKVKTLPFHASTPQLLYTLRSPWTEISNSAATEQRHETPRYDVLLTCLRMINKDTLHRIPDLVEFFIWKSTYKDLNNWRPTALLQISETLWKEANKTENVEDDILLGMHRSAAQKAEHRFRRALVGKAITGSQPNLTLRTGLNAHKRDLGEAEYCERLAQADDHTIELDREPTTLEVLYAFLASLGNRWTISNVDHIICMEREVKLNPAVQDSPEKLLIRLWVAMCLTIRAETSILNTEKVTKILAQVFEKANRESEQDLLASVLDTLRPMRLPAKNKLLRRIHAFDTRLHENDPELATSQRLEPRRGYHDLLDKLDRLNDMDLSVLKDTKSYFVVLHHFPRILQRVAESMNQDMSTFENQALRLINETVGGPSLLLKRLLPHNQALLRAIGNQKSIEVGLDTQEILGGYSYQQLLGMFDKFAWACATTEGLSRNNACRYTFCIVELLEQHGVPISRSVLEALWYAGITRISKQSYHVVRDLKYLVQKHGGTAFAKQLLREAAQRDHESSMVRERSCDAAVTDTTAKEDNQEDAEEERHTPSGLAYVPFKHDQ